MNNEVQVFNHPQFGSIRIVQVDGKEMFCLSDVCKALGLSIPARVKSRLEKRGITTMNTPTYNQHGTEILQSMNFIDEPNLYRCIFQSRKVEAEQFQTWVFEDVLPSIRKTGAYMTRQTLMTVMQKPESILSICKKLVELNEENERLAPKAQYADEVLLADGCITTTELGKDLDMTRPQIFSMLHKMGVIFRGPSGKWMLYAEHHGKGYTTYRTQTYDTLFGKGSRSTLVWTERGRKFVHSLFH